MKRYGPQTTDGGYQAPSTDAVRITRGKPIQEQAWTIGTHRVELKVVPLEGGRPELFELELHDNDPVAKRTVYTPCMVRGGELAREAFARTAARLDAGEIPDVVILPPGAPLGW